MSKPEVLRNGLFSMQICVPKEWTDAQAAEFANRENPAGTTNGWRMRKQGCEDLAGADERVTCSQDGDNVHIMFDC
jgi:hypothetical protein